jgi:hypothetical protein
LRNLLAQERLNLPLLTDDGKFGTPGHHADICRYPGLPPTAPAQPPAGK